MAAHLLIMKFRWLFRTEKKALTGEQILEMLGGGVPTNSGVAVSAETALRVPAVQAAVRTISEACASLAVKVVQIAEDGTETEVPSHPTVALLKHDAKTGRAASSSSALLSLMRSAATKAA